MKLSSLFRNSSGKGFIKICLLGLIFCSLGLTSFSNAYEVILVDYPSTLYNGGVLTLTGSAYVIPTSFNCESSMSCNLVLKQGKKVYLNSVYMPSQQPLINQYSQGYLFSSGSYTILNPQYAGIDDGFSSYTVEIIPVEDCPTCETCEDCSSLSGDLATCQGSLGACLEDNLSLENMNDSLSSELESCLQNNPTGCVPGVDTGCVEGTVVPLLSWSVGLDSFTTPIINNLTLPQNYKGKLVDGVLTISSINNNLSISDSDIESIKDSLVEVVLCIFGFSLFLVLIYYIKFYIFNFKK